MASLDAANYLTVRIFKRAAANPAHEWANSYEIDKTLIDFDYETTATAMAEAMVDAERLLHLSVVEFTRVEISSWQQDNVPYDPRTFVTVPISGIAGNVTPIGQEMARNVCLYIKRNVASGRYGKLFYRGCLTENDVEGSAALEWTLSTTARSLVNARLIDVYADMNAAIDSAMPGAHLALVGIPKYTTDPIARAVLSLSVGGVTVNKSDHKYFDRAPS